MTASRQLLSLHCRGAGYDGRMLVLVFYYDNHEKVGTGGVKDVFVVTSGDLGCKSRVGNVLSQCQFLCMDCQSKRMMVSPQRCGQVNVDYLGGSSV